MVVFGPKQNVLWQRVWLFLSHAHSQRLRREVPPCNCARVCLGPALVEVSEGGPAARGTIHFGIVWRETLFRAM